jgi:hypothetical protein
MGYSEYSHGLLQVPEALQYQIRQYYKRATLSTHMGYSESHGLL